MTETDTALNDIREARSLWAEAWHRLRRNKLAMVCLGVILVFLLIAVLDLIAVPVRMPGVEQANATVEAQVANGAQEDVPTERLTLIELLFYSTVGRPNKEESYVPPMTTGRAFLEDKLEVEEEYGRATGYIEDAMQSATGLHVLGTDQQGHDVLLLTLRGTRTAVLLGLGTALISIPIGLLLGICAGYFGGRVDDLIVYLYSTLACVPAILLLIALMYITGRGLWQLCLALGITGWVGLCRLIRGQTLSLREQEYVLAARAIGASNTRIILRHMVPNLFHIVIITFTLSFGGIVMSEAILSYLGLGVEVDTVSWGRMIQGARMELSRQPSVWWPLTSAAAALFLLVLAFHILGDALRDALDPRLKK